MKVQGKKLDSPNVVSIVIPREDGDIVLKAAGLTNFDEFNKICPVPKPPEVKHPDGSTTLDQKDEDYIKALNTWCDMKSAWMILTSLSVTPGLEWETVDMSDTQTWVNYTSELSSAGFTEYELSRIIEGVTIANGVNQTAIDAAEKRFLAGQGQGQ